MSALAAWGDALGQDLSSLTNVEDRKAKIERLIGARRMLLVIDDAWELDAARAMKCGGEHCAYLLTTRDKTLAMQFAGRGQVETLPVLPDDAAWNLLQSLAPTACAADPDAARSLARAVGGLPLAVELLGGYLAAQEGALFPEIFGDLTKDALAELADPRRRLQLASQRLGSKGGKMTLEQTLSLSLNDLPAETQKAFYALGAFAPKPATFSREAAEAVIGGDENPGFSSQAEGRNVKGKNRAAQSLARLAARNLLEIVETRFALHQSLADLARSKMPPEAQTRHREYYLGLVNEDRRNWQLIEIEFKQIWWGWEHNPADETKLDWVWAIHRFMNTRGLWADYIQCGEIARQLVKDRKAEGTLLNNLGSVYNKLGQRAKALEYYERALPIFEEVGDRQGASATLNNLGSVYDNLGQRGKALEYYERALPIREEVGDRYVESITRYNISRIYQDEGKLDEAVVELRKVVALSEQVQSPHLERFQTELAQLEAELATRGSGQ